VLRLCVTRLCCDLSALPYSTRAIDSDNRMGSLAVLQQNSIVVAKVGIAQNFRVPAKCFLLIFFNHLNIWNPRSAYRLYKKK
jgi:hypothetical protein